MILEQPFIENNITRPNENKKLCKEILCITISSTFGCAIFMLWFIHEINLEFHNSTTYMDLNR